MRSMKTDPFSSNALAGDVKTADLYFVRAGEFVKVGRTTNFPARLVSIQTGCPFKIEAAHLFVGLGSMERQMHRALARDAANGEWFKWGDAAERCLNRMRQHAFEMAGAAQHLRDIAAGRQSWIGHPHP